MQPIDAHHNYEMCGGPSLCDYCRSILNETAERGHQRISAENHARGLRTAAERDYEPPDPYEPQLTRLRAELPLRAWPEPPVAPSPAPTDFTPPDPYQSALDKLLKENR